MKYISLLVLLLSINAFAEDKPPILYDHSPIVADTISIDPKSSLEIEYKSLVSDSLKIEAINNGRLRPLNIVMSKDGIKSINTGKNSFVFSKSDRISITIVGNPSPTSSLKITKIN